MGLSPAIQPDATGKVARPAGEFGVERLFDRPVVGKVEASPSVIVEGGGLGVGGVAERELPVRIKQIDLTS